MAHPFEQGHEYDAPAETSRDSTHFLHGTVGWATGQEAIPRHKVPGFDPGVGCLLIALFLVLAFNFSHYTTFIKNFAQDLWRVGRQNVFDKVNTLNETRIQASLIVLVCVCEGVLLWEWGLSDYYPPFAGIILVSCLCFVYMAIQWVAYAVTGTVFGTPDITKQWLRGFSASQCLLGLTLVIPAVVSLFYPGGAMVMALIGAVLYVAARVIFISKGFRLFFDGISSTCYFILYLCTLEIAPLVVIIRRCGEYTK